MVSYKKLKIIDFLRKEKLPLVDINLLGSLSGLKNRQSLDSFAKSLIKLQIIEKAEKGKYLVNNVGNDFIVANLLYKPSYVSLETALNLHGMLSQFPYEITSITTKRKIEKDINGKLFTYYHLDKKYFWGYEKNGGALIALPEKALLDQLYLVSKGLRGVDIEDLDLSFIDKKTFIEFSAGFPQSKKFIKLIKKII